MTTGEKPLKLISILLVCLIFGLFSLQGGLSAKTLAITDATANTEKGTNANTEKPQVTPPTIEDAHSFLREIREKTGNFFKNFKIFGKGTNLAGSFLKDVGNRIGSWWFSEAKPWIEYCLTHITAYLNEEVRIE